LDLVRLDTDPERHSIAEVRVMTITLAISFLVVAWLSICAVFDIRTRHVPNLLTLSPIPLALLAAWLTRESRSETPYELVFHLVILMVPLFAAWRSHLLGGADLKIMLVLTLANPLLVVAAWIGVVVFFVGLLIVHRSRPTSFAGVPGFALGVGLFTICQIAMLFNPFLAV
jgi:Flp pilus assembly protein protease CpaA